jgi:hypothetical protein
MPKYAIVIGGVVQTIAEANPGWVNAQNEWIEAGAFLIPVDDSVSRGDLYDGTVFSKPPIQGGE